MSRNQRGFKVVLLGEGRVGKTSILLRYVRGEFDDRQQSTIQASYLDKKVKVKNQDIHLSIWDTAGQERYHSLGPIYYREADGALLVYDITDTESFEKVKKWVTELYKIVKRKNISVVIAGNKCDLEKRRAVNKQQVEEYAQSVGAVHIETSAKQNKGIEDCFIDIANRILERRESRKQNGLDGGMNSSSGLRPAGNRGLLLVDDDFDRKKPNSGCC